MSSNWKYKTSEETHSEGRYKAFMIRAYKFDNLEDRKTNYFDLDILELIFNNCFQRFKVSLVRDNNGEIPNGLPGPAYFIKATVNTRKRTSTVARMLFKYTYNYFIAAELEPDEAEYEAQKSYFFVTKMSGRFEDDLPGQLIITSDDVSNYRGEDIQLLDNRTKRYPWQSDVLNFIYDERKEEFIPSDDRTIVWIQDKSGNTGKSKFIKWICVNRPNEVAKITFGTSSQLRSSLISAGPRLCYFIDIPRTKGYEDSLDSIISTMEDLKSGHIVSNFYGKYTQLIMNPPHIIIFSNEDCPKKKLSLDRWKIFKIDRKSFKLVDIT